MLETPLPRVHGLTCHHHAKHPRRLVPHAHPPTSTLMPHLTAPDSYRHPTSWQKKQLQLSTSKENRYLFLPSYRSEKSFQLIPISRNTSFIMSLPTSPSWGFGILIGRLSKRKYGCLFPGWGPVSPSFLSLLINSR